MRLLMFSNNSFLILIWRLRRSKIAITWRKRMSNWMKTWCNDRKFSFCCLLHIFYVAFESKITITLRMTSAVSSSGSLHFKSGKARNNPCSAKLPMFMRYFHRFLLHCGRKTECMGWSGKTVCFVKVTFHDTPCRYKQKVLGVAIMISLRRLQ